MGRSAYSLAATEMQSGAEVSRLRFIDFGQLSACPGYTALRLPSGPRLRQSAVLMSRNQMVFGRQGRGLSTIGRAQFLKAGADMVPGCGMTDHQLFCNLLVTQSLDHQRQYLAFSWAQIAP